MAQQEITTDQNIASLSEALDGGQIVSYVINLVKDAREVRDQKYKANWDMYERTYRGIYSGADQSREGERSRLIAPALTQAIDSIHAGIIDAIFSREQWIDLKDESVDKDKSDIEKARINLMEDLDLTNVQDAISKIVLNGCLYGTGIGKVNVIKKRMPSIKEQTYGGPVMTYEDRPLVSLEAVPPWEYVIDSQARDQASAHFEATETHVPKNVVQTKQVKGVYRDAALAGFNTSSTPHPAGESSVEQRTARDDVAGAVWVTEYYGLVPAKLVKAEGIKIPESKLLGNGMVECIVTIANESELLRIVLNPFIMIDRPIVAYQHSYTPGKWWGAGVAEKGWNAQRALDAELRARMDALGLLTSPMMGADITRLPRNPDMRVRPGKVWLTRGRPSEVLEPIILGNIDPNTFNQSSEMERLVQVGTGSVESNAPLNSDRRNETASGISMIQSSALKRQRATMANIERQFLNPFVRKAMWRLMQFNPQRYTADYEFCVKGTMGIVAREFEQASLTSLLQVISPDSAAHGILLRGIVELSGSPQRDEMVAAIVKAQEPDPAAQKEAEEHKAIQKAMLQEQLKELQLENMKTQAEIEEIKAKTAFVNKQAELEDDKVEIQAMNAAAAIGKVKMDHTTRAKDRDSRERTEMHKANTAAKSKAKPRIS